MIAPTLGGFLIQQVGRWAPGIFSALIMAWVITFVYRRVVLPAHRERLAAEQEAAHA